MCLHVHVLLYVLNNSLQKQRRSLKGGGSPTLSILMPRQGVAYPSFGWLWIVSLQMARGSMDMHTASLVHTNQ
jgi:hypothetical protein